MKLSIHSTIHGKPSKVLCDDGKTRYYCDGQKVSLGYGWVNVESEWDDVFNLITVDGCATAPYLSCDNRKDATFVEHCLALVDIDSGMTIEQLFEHPFYDVFGAGFYTTPSHTDSDHRFRIIHRLEQPITNAEEMRLLYRALMGEYGNADASCKDAARLFFGTVNCLLKEQRSNTLPKDVVDYLVSELRSKDAEQVKTMDQVEYPPLNDEKKQRIIDLLKQSYIGQYEQWRNIGWGMRSGGFTLADFQNVTQGLMSEKTAANAKDVWDDYKADGKVPTMGTVIHFLKTRHGADCLLEPNAAREAKVSKYLQHLSEIQQLEAALKRKMESNNE